MSFSSLSWVSAVAQFSGALPAAGDSPDLPAPQDHGALCGSGCGNQGVFSPLPARDDGQDFDGIAILNLGIQPIQKDAVPAVYEDGLHILGGNQLLVLEDSLKQPFQMGRSFELDVYVFGAGKLPGAAVQFDPNHSIHPN